MPAEVLSGNLTVDTYFMVKGVVFAKKSYRIYYDDWLEYWSERREGGKKLLDTPKYKHICNIETTFRIKKFTLNPNWSLIDTLNKS